MGKMNRKATRAFVAASVLFLSAVVISTSHARFGHSREVVKSKIEDSLFVAKRVVQKPTLSGQQRQAQKPAVQRPMKADTAGDQYPIKVDLMSSSGRLAYRVAEARAKQPNGGKGSSFRIDSGELC